MEAELLAGSEAMEELRGDARRGGHGGAPRGRSAVAMEDLVRAVWRSSRGGALHGGNGGARRGCSARRPWRSSAGALGSGPGGAHTGGARRGNGGARAGGARRGGHHELRCRRPRSPADPVEWRQHPAATGQDAAKGGRRPVRRTHDKHGADGILWVFIMTATANVRTHEKQAVSGSARSAGTMKCVCT